MGPSHRFSKKDEKPAGGRVGGGQVDEEWRMACRAGKKQEGGHKGEQRQRAKESAYTEQVGRPAGGSGEAQIASTKAKQTRGSHVAALRALKLELCASQDSI